MAIRWQPRVRRVVGVCVWLVVMTAVTPCTARVHVHTDMTTPHRRGTRSSPLLTIVRAVLGLPVHSHHRGQGLTLPGSAHRRSSKRGFGIAGLDNVDMITSILDQSRSRSRSRPKMTSGVSLNRLRALMAKAG